ncbi:MAG: transport system ATP-binding/permease protein [Nocardioidaceae bacterium]|nr:transport system ATP-binding/permease protein [Nocardioidaceae bacterium]
MAHLLGVESIALDFPTKTVFESVTIGIDEGDRIGRESFNLLVNVHEECHEILLSVSDNPIVRRGSTDEKGS